MITNVEMLNEVQANMSIFPDLPMSFSEMSILVDEVSESGFNQLFEAAGINELAVFESTGSMIIYEGENLANFKKSAKKLFQDIWAAIKGFFTKIYQTINNKIKEFKDKVGNDIINKINLDNIDDDANLGKMHDFSRFKKWDIKSDVRALAREIQSKFNDARKSNDVDEEVADLMDSYKKKIMETAYTVEGSNVTEYKKNLRKKLEGEIKEVKKSDVDITELKKVLAGDFSKKTFSADYTAMKGEIDDIISGINKMDDDATKTISKEISLLKDLVAATKAAIAVKADVAGSYFRESTNLIVRLTRLSKDTKEEKKATNESYAFQEDLVKTVFNW